MRASHASRVVTSEHGSHAAPGHPTAQSPLPTVQPGHHICPSGHWGGSTGTSASPPLVSALPAVPEPAIEGLPPFEEVPPFEEAPPFDAAPPFDCADPACADALPAVAVPPVEPASSSNESLAVQAATV